MRNLKIYLTFILIVIFSSYVFSQNEEYKSTWSAYQGFSNAEQTLRKIDCGEGAIIETHSSLAYQLNWDYWIGKQISIGGAMSYQKVWANISIQNSTSAIHLERFNLAIRFLYHYKTGDRLDLYSGIRSGITYWEGMHTAKQFFTEIPPVLHAKYFPQIIPLGMRWYFTKQVGIGFEFGIGSPHYFSAGIHLRMPKALPQL